MNTNAILIPKEHYEPENSLRNVLSESSQETPKDSSTSVFFLPWLFYNGFELLKKILSPKIVALAL